MSAPAPAPSPRPLRHRLAGWLALLGAVGFPVVAALLYVNGRTVFDGMWLAAILSFPSLLLTDPIGEALFPRNIHAQFMVLVLGGAVQYAVIGSLLGWALGVMIETTRRRRLASH